MPVEVTRTASSKTARAGRAEKSEKVEKVVRGGRNVVATLHKKNGKTVVAVQRRSVVRVEAPPRQSFGQMAGLHGTEDVLDLKSSVALVVDQTRTRCSSARTITPFCRSPRSPSS